MINPLRYAHNLFDDRDFYDNDLQAFAEDHLIRLTNNNPGGVYALLITETSNKHQAYFGNLVSEITKTAVREGLTQSMKQARALMIKSISSIGKLADFKFAAHQEVFQQFFPQGVREYYYADLGETNPLIERLQGAAAAHLTADYPNDVAALNLAITGFKNARSAQLNAFSQEEILASERRLARKALTRQLTRNLLLLSSDFIDQPRMLKKFYNLRLLPLRGKKHSAETVQEYTIAAGQRLNVGKAPADETVIRIEHVRGNGNMQCCTTATENTDCTGNVYIMEPGKTFEGPFGNLNISGGGFLYIMNTGTDAMLIRIEVME